MKLTTKLYTWFTIVGVCEDFFNWKIPTVEIVRSHYSVPYGAQPLTEIELQ